jgi:hypothetical protein
MCAPGRKGGRGFGGGGCCDPAPVAIEESSEELVPEPSDAQPIESPAGALREGLMTDETAESVRELILDGLKASRTVFTDCRHCQKRRPVNLPDLGTRITAARALVEEIGGKLHQQTKGLDEQVAEVV